MEEHIVGQNITTSNTVLISSNEENKVLAAVKDSVTYSPGKNKYIAGEKMIMDN